MLKLTVAEVARMAGVAPNTIVRVEADKSVNRREAGEAEVVPLAPARRGLIGEGLVWRWECLDNFCCDSLRKGYFLEPSVSWPIR